MNRSRMAAAAAATLVLPLAGVLAAAAPASATTTIVLTVGCSAVNIRTGPSTADTILGVGYRGDKDLISKGVMHDGSYTWFYGTVTRASDHRRVTGWTTASCTGY